MTLTLEEQEYLNSLKKFLINKDTLPYAEIMNACKIIMLKHTLGSQLHKQVRSVCSELAVHYTIREVMKQHPDVKYCVMNGVILPKQTTTGTNEIDNLVITSKAIFVIETKSYYGNIIVNEDETLFNSKTNIKFNPVKQNTSHCNTLYDNIYSYVFDKKLIYNIICIMGNYILEDNRHMLLRKKHPILNIKNLYIYIDNVLRNINQKTINSEITYNYIKKINLGTDDAEVNKHINNVIKLRK